MVHRTYSGLGSRDAAIREFDALTPYALDLLGLQQECTPLGPDHTAVAIALDALQTAAFHFTLRRHFYHSLEEKLAGRREGNARLSERAEALAAFVALTPYVDTLRALQRRCRPFGRDYLALDIAVQGIRTAAFHFTRQSNLYGAAGDSAGPVRGSANQ